MTNVAQRHNYWPRRDATTKQRHKTPTKTHNRTTKRCCALFKMQIEKMHHRKLLLFQFVYACCATWASTESLHKDNISSSNIQREQIKTQKYYHNDTQKNTQDDHKIHKMTTEMIRKLTLRVKTSEKCIDRTTQLTWKRRACSPRICHFKIPFQSILLSLFHL